MTQISMSFNDIEFVTFGRYNYRIRFWGISKCKTMNKISNTDLSEKKG